MIDTKALREKVLDLAIRGKLVPQDPNDEPASVLLERIRAEKEQMVKDGKLKAKDIKNDTFIYRGEDNLHYEKFQDGTVKCIEDEIPFEVPEGWVWARMSSLTHDLPYGTSKKSSSRGEIAVLRMGNLQQGEIDYTDLVYSSDKEDIGKYLLTAGDLLFNRTNSSEWVGKTAIYRGELAAIYAGYLIRIRPFLEGEYLNCVMNSGYIKEICLLVKTDAVNQSNINATKLGRFLIPVPPFNEQLKISKKVFETLYWINFIVTEKNELGQCIQQIKSKILNLAIRGQLVPQNPDDEPASVLLEHIRAEKEELIRHGKIKRDKTESVIFKGDDNSYYETNYGDIKKCIDDEIIFKLPVGWSWCRMHQLFNITSSKRVLQSDWCNEGIPFYRAREIVKLSNNGYVDNDLFISLEHYQKIKEEYGIPQRGDLMVTGVGTIGKVYIVQENDKFYYKDASVLCFENRTGYVDSKFARYLIESDLIQNQIYSKTYGNTVDTITISIANKYMCVLPPINEQKRIVETIDVLFSYIDNIYTTIL